MLAADGDDAGDAGSGSLCVQCHGDGGLQCL